MAWNTAPQSQKQVAALITEQGWTVEQALEWALDCLDSGDEVIGAPELGVSVVYDLNGVKMSRATTYAESKIMAENTLTHRHGNLRAALTEPTLDCLTIVDEHPNGRGRS